MIAQVETAVAVECRFGLVGWRWSRVVNPVAPKAGAGWGKLRFGAELGPEESSLS